MWAQNSVYRETQVRRTSWAVNMWYGLAIFCILDSPAIILYLLEAENIQVLNIFRICTNDYKYSGFLQITYSGHATFLYLHLQNWQVKLVCPNVEYNMRTQPSTGTYLSVVNIFPLKQWSSFSMLYRGNSFQCFVFLDPFGQQFVPVEERDVIGGWLLIA
jgi:hypothetical protein